jgi:8-oxo-dGTP pyrophosphatase MutT (NUDIX family)
MGSKTLAKILVKDSRSGKYLILRSSEWPENPKRSLQPDLPGGEVEEDETPEAGVLRELKEETGIDLSENDLKLVEVLDDKHNKRFVYFAECSDPEIVLSWEHDKLWWKTADEVLEMIIREPYPQIFKSMQDNGFLI